MGADCPVAIDLLKLAAPIPPPLRHYFVWPENESALAERIQISRFGTLSEIRAPAAWLQAWPEILSMLILSSSCHLFEFDLLPRPASRPITFQIPLRS